MTPDVIIAVALLLLIVLNLIILPIKNKIKTCKSIQESNKLRQKAKIIIIIGAVLLVISSSALFFIDDSIDDFWDSLRTEPIKCLICLFLVGLSEWIIIKDVTIRGNPLIKILGYDKILMKISTKGADSVPEKFVLYLRGFRQDSYSLETDIEVKAYKGRFAEHRLCEYLKNSVPVYAVGMNKELWQPKGADRVYVDDDCWKEDVNNLMEKSLMNVILVNDRSSCIWEIEQSCSKLNKTIFVVDDVEVYKRAKACIKGMEFPEVDLKKYWDGFCFYQTYKGFEIIPFDPSKEAEYGKLSNIIIKKTGVSKDLSKDAKIIYKTSAILSLMPVIQFVVDFLHQNTPVYAINVAVSFFILVLIALSLISSYRLLLKVNKSGFYRLIITMIVCAVVGLFMNNNRFVEIDFTLILLNILNGFLVMISPSYGLASKAFFEEKH